jgi:heterodisulfide reductase subunit A
LKDINTKVLIIGGGIAGISAALEISKNGIPVDIVETAPFLGGHAVGFSCKATDKCVKCGACIVEEKLDHVTNASNIALMLNSQVKKVSKNGDYSVSISRDPMYIDPEKCTNCGKCYKKCPETDAVIQGFSKNNHPFYAINIKNCRNSKKQSCNICVDVCPENAIDLKRRRISYKNNYNAIIAATGFQTFNPKDKPYGYGKFENVITNLDLERMFKIKNKVLRPSDNKEPEKIAFVQCVGSRDSKLNHLWCSRICCGSAMRLANLIKSRAPETDITVFYIDIQTFSSDFEKVYKDLKHDLRMIRTIPGDVLKTKDDKLRVTYYNACDETQTDAVFDMLVLSIGLTPCDDSSEMFDLLNIPAFDFKDPKDKKRKNKKDIFTAGAMEHPMNIAESIASAQKAAIDALKYLKVI